MVETGAPIRIVLLGGGPDDELLLQAAVQTDGSHLVGSSVPEEIPEFGTLGVDAVVLSFPPVDGLGLLQWARSAMGEAPIVVLAGGAEEAYDVPSIRAGADDFLIRERTDGFALARSIRLAVARSRRERDGAGIDPLTGLRTRAGLASIAEHEMRQADRSGEVLPLIFLAIEQLEAARRDHGSNEVNRLVQEAAEVIVNATRDADVPARLGPGAFCVLLTGAVAGTESAVLSRLVEAIATRNARSATPVPLSLAVGVARYHPEQPADLDELLRRAEASMHEGASGGP